MSVAAASTVAVVTSLYVHDKLLHDCRAEAQQRGTCKLL